MKRMWSKNELIKQVKEVKKDITTLVDAQGHERFIEGEININEINGVSKIYGKWSLSGSHLLIVLCISVLNTTAIGGETLCTIDLPSWVKNKIVPIMNSNGIVEFKTFTAYSEEFETQQIVTYIDKKEEGTIISLKCSSSTPTLTSDKKVRISYDFLIDNE